MSSGWQNRTGSGSAGRLERARERLDRGFYEHAEIQREIARRLLASGAVTPSFDPFIFRGLRDPGSL